MTEQKPQQGYFVLADISGYTSFMAGTELEHSHEIIHELIELVIDRLIPPLRLCEVEGDAVFSFAPEHTFQRGETLVEVTESAYVAFRDRIASMRRKTTCECKACNSISTLDLKFITHYGDYVQKEVAGHKKIVGSDINLAHRLLKNTVSQKTGWRAYSLFTQMALHRLALSQSTFHPQTESYEHFGDVQTYSLDLHPRYDELVEARHVVVDKESGDGSITHEFPAPPAILWDWLTDPVKRTEITEGREKELWTPGVRLGGRTKAGAQNHCAHGKSVATENILDWRPFSYYTAEFTEPPSKVSFLCTFRLTETDGGTCLECHSKVNIPLPKILRRLLFMFAFGKPVKKKWMELSRRLTLEMQATS